MHKRVCFYWTGLKMTLIWLLTFSCSPFQERMRCFWTCEGRKLWKTFRPWEPATAARCWARWGSSLQQAGYCWSAQMWCSPPWRSLPCCCPGSSASVDVPWKSDDNTRNYSPCWLLTGLSRKLNYPKYLSAPWRTSKLPKKHRLGKGLNV